MIGIGDDDTKLDDEIRIMGSYDWCYHENLEIKMVVDEKNYHIAY